MVPRTAEVRWIAEILGDSPEGGNTTVPYYPSGTVTATPTDDNEVTGDPGRLVSTYRAVRTLHMSNGVLMGDLPVDIEGTGWAWKFTASLTYRNGAGKTLVWLVPTFYGVSREGQVLDLAEASKGAMSSPTVWTTAGKDGRSVTRVLIGAGNEVQVTYSDGASSSAGNLDLSGVTASASVDSLVGATNLGKSLVAAADAAEARDLLGAGTSSLTLGDTASTAKPGDYRPAVAQISDATAPGRNLLKVAAPTAAKLVQINADGTVTLVDAPTGTGGGETPTATAADLDALMAG